MANDDAWVAGVDDDEEEEQESEFYNYSDVCMFLIESNSTMLAVPEAGQSEGSSKKVAPPPQSNLLMALRAAHDLMRKKIIATPKDYLGILVYNTARGSQVGEDDWANCVLVQDLVQVDALHIKKLQTFIEAGEKDPKTLEDRFAPQQDGPNSLEPALNACISRFKEKCPKLAVKRCFVLTDNADPYPHTGNHDDVAKFRSVSITRAQDFAQMGVAFEPFFINRPGTEGFDRRIFWDSLLRTPPAAAGSDDLPAGPVARQRDVAELIKELIDSASTRESSKRSQFSIPFNLSEDLRIGINGYVLVTEEKRKAYTWYDPHTRKGEEVKVVTEFSDTASTEKVAARDVMRFYPVGDPKDHRKARRVIFSTDEQERARNLGLKPGLTLLGFKPRRALEWQHHLKHSYFIHPNESEYTGSARTFAALVHAMDKKSKIGYGVFMPRRNSTPQLVALLPQLEEYSDDGVQVLPSGIHLCQLPWADETRPAHLNTTLGVLHADEEESEAIEHAKTIVKKLKKGYQPNDFPNPALNFHYNCLAAIALGAKDGPEAVDETEPSYGVFQNRCGLSIENLKAAVARHPDATERFGDAPKTSKKRRKADEAADDSDVAKVEDAFKAGRQSKLLVRELVGFLVHRGVIEGASKHPPKAELLALAGEALGA